MRTLAYILISGLLGVSGQLLLKQGLLASEPPVLAGASAALAWLLDLALNPLIVLGLTIYIGGTFFWLLVLTRVDLSYAYPFASLNYILVLLASWWFLGEQVTAKRLTGVALISLGVWAISRTKANSTEPARAAASGEPDASYPVAVGGLK